MSAGDWTSLEEEIAGLLPGAGVPSPDRPRLLAVLGSYAAAVVAEARRRGALPPTAAERGRALEWLDRPVFLCGHHRTGTTLLHDLLDGHPELLVLPSEGTYFTSFPGAARREVPPAEVDHFAAEWICRLVDPNYEPHFLLGRGAGDDHPSVLFVRRLLGWETALRQAWPRRAPFALLLALVVAFADVAAPAHRPRLWVEKTPLNETRASTFAGAFPRARFIQLVRDPRTTLASALEVGRPPDRDRSFAQARSIGRSLRLARSNRRRHRSRYLVVRYEDLAATPEREMERVRDFLGIAPHPSLAIPTVLERPVRSNSSFDRGELGVVVPPRSSAALSTDAEALVRVLAGGPARALGYDVPPLAVGRRLLLLLRTAPPWALERARRKL